MKKLITGTVMAAVIGLPALVPTVASATVSSTVAEATTSPDPSLHPTKVTNKSRGAKVMGSRKATEQDVASGFAASTAATIYLCNAGITIRNPINDQFDSDYAAYIGWEESTSSGGYPMARISTGSALFVKNNDTRSIFWASATWTNNSGSYQGTQYAWANWRFVQTYLNEVAANGGQLGMKITSLGNADPNNPSNAWSMAHVEGSGFRNYISNSVVGPAFNSPGSQPILGITTWGSAPYASDNTNTLIGIEATNSSPCGYLVD